MKLLLYPLSLSGTNGLGTKAGDVAGVSHGAAVSNWIIEAFETKIQDLYHKAMVKPRPDTTSVVGLCNWTLGALVSL